MHGHLATSPPAARPLAEVPGVGEFFSLPFLFSLPFWPAGVPGFVFLPAKARVVVKTGAASRPRLGQHFLRDAGVRDRVLAAVPADGLPLLEVGPGMGR